MNEYPVLLAFRVPFGDYIFMFKLCRKHLYTVQVYYRGHIVHVPMFSYDNSDKVYNNVDPKNMTIKQLKVYVGEILG